MLVQELTKESEGKFLTLQIPIATRVKQSKPARKTEGVKNSPFKGHAVARKTERIKSLASWNGVLKDHAVEIHSGRENRSRTYTWFSQNLSLSEELL